MPPSSSKYQLGDYVDSLKSTLTRRSGMAMNYATSKIHEIIPRDTQHHHKYNPGQGAKPPESFNNKGWFALFGILGAAMVLTSIWFFFWAKNGGFVWRRGDWDDYKSTVLRRKDKNGNTLSNATKTTYLGEKSIAGTFDVEKEAAIEATDWAHQDAKQDGLHRQNATKPGQRPRGQPREPSDEDVRAYRQEKAARVGGINRLHDGNHFDYSSTDRSSTVSDNSTRQLWPKEPVAEEPKKKGLVERTKEKKQERKREKAAKKARANGNAPVAETNPTPDIFRQPTSVPQNQVPRQANSPRHGNGSPVRNSPYAERREYNSPPVPRHNSPRQGQPQRYHNSPRQSRASLNNANPYAPRQPSPIKNQYPGSFDAYSDDDDDSGTKSYTHHIPELGRASRDTGFRRGGRLNRRDSLSDSDGDLANRRF